MLGVKRLGLIAGLAMLGLVPAAAAQAAAAPSTQDRQFLESIHRINLVVISTGNAATQRGSDPQVQNLGASFVTDHAKIDQSVQSSASSNGVTLPDAPTNEQVTTRDQLQNLNGNAFDKQWVSAQLTWQMAASQLVRTEQTQGSDAGIKKIANDAAPVLQSHHNALVALAKKLGVAVPTAAPTPSPSGSSATPGPSGTSGTPGQESGTPGPGATSGAPGPSVTSNEPAPGSS